MKFGIFLEHQIPRPWAEGDEHRLFQEVLAQVEAADRLGLHYVWEVEHHFLEEYSHSAAPEVFLAACSQRTKQIRLGHGIVLMPPAFNPPARVAERIATLDLVSSGRVEFGTGESASRVELEGFGVPPDQKNAMWAEAVEQACNLMVMEPYPGYQGRHFSIPCRNLVPKPVQKPHPPLWVACASRDTMLRAARHGMGALTFAFLGAAEARHWVDDYYRTLERECVPIGHAVNPNVAVVCPLSCHRSEEQAILRGLEGFLFFNFSLGYYYNFGRHRPGLSDVWQAFNLARRTELPPMTRPAGIGTPAQLREDLTLLAQAGVDQVVFLQQTGRTPHDQIMESLELFAREVMPGLVEDEPQREANKRARLAGAVEAALGRKRWMAPIDRGEIPEIHAYGRGRR